MILHLWCSYRTQREKRDLSSKESPYRQPVLHCTRCVRTWIIALVLERTHDFAAWEAKKSETSMMVRTERVIRHHQLTLYHHLRLTPSHGRRFEYYTQRSSSPHYVRNSRNTCTADNSIINGTCVHEKLSAASSIGQPRPLQPPLFSSFRPREHKIATSHPLSHVAWSCDGKKLAAVGTDKTTRVWTPEKSVRS